MIFIPRRPVMFKSVSAPALMLNCLALLGAGFVSAATPPAVIWASDPVRPGETVVVRGDAFGAQARVEVLGTDRATLAPTEVFQQTDRTLKFLLPAASAPGITSFRVVTSEGTSPAVVLNAPHSKWLQGDETGAAAPRRLAAGLWPQPRLARRRQAGPQPGRPPGARADAPVDRRL